MKASAPAPSTRRATRKRANPRARVSGSSGVRTASSGTRTFSDAHCIENASGNIVASANGSDTVL